MTYAAASNIQTADYNSLLGSTATTGAVLPSLINKGEGLNVFGDIVTRANAGAIAGWATAKSSLGFSSGKYYWEVTVESAAAAAGTNYIMVGIANAAASVASYAGADTNGWSFYNMGGSPAVQNYYRGGTATTYGSGTFDQGAVIGVLVDMTALTLTFYKNNVSQGAIAITAGTYYPTVSLYTEGNSVSINHGQRDFVYAIPSGASVLAPASTAQLGTIFGTGYGDWGYLQSAPTLTPLSGTGNISATDWYNFESAVTKIINHQGVAQSLNPPIGDFVANANVKAYTAPANTAYSMSRTLAALQKNRQVAAAGAMTVYLPTTYGVRLTSGVAWGTGAASGLYCEAKYDFASEENARAFFNTGGELRISLNHSNTTTMQNTAWGTICSGIGTIKFGANSTGRTGTLGYTTGNGYFQLTTAEKNIFVGANIGGGSYTANDVTITARALQVGGANGGKGYQIVIKVYLADQHTNAFSDTVAAGTIGDFGFYKATTYLTAVSPTVSQQTAWTTYTA